MGQWCSNLFKSGPTSVQIGPTFTEFVSRLRRSIPGQAFVVFGPISAESGRPRADVGRTRFGFERLPAKLVRFRAKIGRFPSYPSRAGCVRAQCVHPRAKAVDMCHMRPNIGRDRLEFGRFHARLADVTGTCPTLTGRFGPNSMERFCSDLRRSRPNGKFGPPSQRLRGVVPEL